MSNSRVFIVFYFFTNLGLPCASHTPLPYTSHTPPIRLPYASHTPPPIHLPYTSHTPPIHLPDTSQTPPIHLPYTSHTPKTFVFSTCLAILGSRKLVVSQNVGIFRVCAGKRKKKQEKSTVGAEEQSPNPRCNLSAKDFPRADICFREANGFQQVIFLYPSS